MKYRIVLVPFPFDDLSGSKLRPAICLTDALTTYQHIVIAFITSQIQKATEPSDLTLLTTDTDFLQTGLKVDSAIRLHRLVTIPTRLIQRQLGVLPGTNQADWLITGDKDLLVLDPFGICRIVSPNTFAELVGLV